MKVLRALLVVVGFLSVGLGTLGLFVPILPAPPLYLLATVCFAKGSERFHKWFTGSKLYKNHFESFTKDRSMTLKTKFAILIPATIMHILVYVMIDLIALRIIIAGLLVAKHWYFFFVIKTIRAGQEMESAVL